MEDNQLQISGEWVDYELIDTGEGLRLERWGDVTLLRPDPMAVWKRSSNPLWQQVDALYKRSTAGGGRWEFFRKDIPESWIVQYKRMRFKVRPTGFKHTGLFPEQAVNWDFIISKSKSSNIENTLNLFGYSGAATVAAALGGSKVCHVDASKGAVNWCKENLHLSKIADDMVRLIVDDCLKFIEREVRRGKKYDAIIMDPPAFGRGAAGEVWKLQESLSHLLEICKQLLSDKRSYILINSYTSGLSSLALHNITKDSYSDMMNKGSKLITGEIGLPFRNGEYIMPCGVYARLEF